MGLHLEREWFWEREGPEERGSRQNTKRKMTTEKFPRLEILEIIEKSKVWVST